MTVSLRGRGRSATPRVLEIGWYGLRSTASFAHPVWERRVDQSERGMPMNKLNYLDLFSGIGGFSKGLQKAGIKYGKHYFSEIDKYAIEVYQRHFPGAEPVGDISGVKGKRFGKIDLITFGFPCQDLSLAGKREGMEGARSGLFFEATRLIRELKPSIFIFENVKGRSMKKKCRICGGVEEVV